MSLDFVRTEAVADAEGIVGAQLIHVNAKINHVEFVFLGEKVQTFVRISKEYTFYRSDATKESFEPFFADCINATGSADFVFMRGHHCVSASLDTEAFLFSMTNGMRVHVEFGPKDFEPIQFVGTEGEKYEKLKFWHVL